MIAGASAPNSPPRSPTSMANKLRAKLDTMDTPRRTRHSASSLIDLNGEDIATFVPTLGPRRASASSTGGGGGAAARRRSLHHQSRENSVASIQSLPGATTTKEESMANLDFFPQNTFRDAPDCPATVQGGERRKLKIHSLSSSLSSSCHGPPMSSSRRRRDMLYNKQRQSVGSSARQPSARSLYSEASVGAESSESSTNNQSTTTARQQEQQEQQQPNDTPSNNNAGGSSRGGRTSPHRGTTRVKVPSAAARSRSSERPQNRSRSQDAASRAANYDSDHSTGGASESGKTPRRGRKKVWNAPSVPFGSNANNNESSVEEPRPQMRRRRSRSQDAASRATDSDDSIDFLGWKSPRRGRRKTIVPEGDGAAASTRQGRRQSRSQATDSDDSIVGKSPRLLRRRLARGGGGSMEAGSTHSSLGRSRSYGPTSRGLQQAASIVASLEERAQSGDERTSRRSRRRASVVPNGDGSSGHHPRSRSLDPARGRNSSAGNPVVRRGRRANRDANNNSSRTSSQGAGPSQAGGVGRRSRSSGPSQAQRRSERSPRRSANESTMVPQNRSGRSPRRSIHSVIESTTAPQDRSERSARRSVNSLNASTTAPQDRSERSSKRSINFLNESITTPQDRSERSSKRSINFLNESTTTPPLPESVPFGMSPSLEGSSNHSRGSRRDRSERRSLAPLPLQKERQLSGSSTASGKTARKGRRRKRKEERNKAQNSESEDMSVAMRRGVITLEKQPTATRRATISNGEAIDNNRETAMGEPTRKSLDLSSHCLTFVASSRPRSPGRDNNLVDDGFDVISQSPRSLSPKRKTRSISPKPRTAASRRSPGSSKWQELKSRVASPGSGKEVHNNSSGRLSYSGRRARKGADLPSLKPPTLPHLSAIKIDISNVVPVAPTTQAVGDFNMSNSFSLADWNPDE